MQPNQTASLSTLSFDSYSSRRLTEIAARVVEEFRAESNDDDDGFPFEYDENDFKLKEDDGKDEDDDDEFEFAVVGQDFIPSPTPADEIFYNGQIRPCYPLFNTDLVFGSSGEAEENLGYQSKAHRPSLESARLSLKKLFIEDREFLSSSSSSSSEAADDLDGLQPDSYCVWTPKMVAEEKCKKSNSGGWSKRWRFRELLLRSISDGKDSFVFLTHSTHGNGNTKRIGEKIMKIEKSSSSAVAPEVTIPETAAVGRGGVKTDSERKWKSFLPYRQDLVGFISNKNGLSRNLHSKSERK